MPCYPDFKPHASCSWLMLISDLHESCLKCLGEGHRKDRCRVCKNFCSQTRKERDIRLRALLMEAAFFVQHRNPPPWYPLPELWPWLAAAPLAADSARHPSVSPVLKKRSPSARMEGGALGKGPLSGHAPATGSHRGTAKVGPISPARDPSPAPGRGPQHVKEAAVPEAVSVAKEQG